ncbi:hypothetical protein [Bacillus wiedmannii]|uniref:hypothetical protein n=1 Tax=Bacillus wiedmannii TaxID=1890302 RepID=UPI000CD804CD|nr:hypothetical protein [Bacillus wiedmannii]MBG9829751.1 hypothetical protein [Bacillus wiedmannii]UOB93905.1 hypothetical protein BTI679_12220 [Bacillus wiedmannii]
MDYKVYNSKGKAYHITVSKEGSFYCIKKYMSNLFYNSIINMDGKNKKQRILDQGIRCFGVEQSMLSNAESLLVYVTKFQV